MCTECGGPIAEEREQRCPWCLEPMCRQCWIDRYVGQCSACEKEHGKAITSFPEDGRDKSNRLLPMKTA